MDQQQERTLADIAVIEPLFETDGWKLIVDMLTEEVEVIKSDLLLVKTDRDAAFLQGRAQQCLSLAGLEDYMYNQKNAIANEQELDAQDDDDGRVRL